jgi:peptidyl-prolyl cis-trans isomerase SurA
MIKHIKIIILLFFLISGKGFALENNIILKINNDIITSIDIFNEIKKIKFFNNNLAEIDNEEIYDIALQSLLRNRVKKIEVLKNVKSLEVQNEDYLNLLIQNTYKRLNIDNLVNFKKELSNRDINYEEFKNELKVDIFWNEIIYSKFNNNVVIDEEKLKRQLENSKKNNLEFNLSEIAYQAENINEVEDEYKIIKNDIEKLGFENAALKHSLSNTASNGGNLGWVNEKAINDEILNQIKSIPVNSITKPIKIASGFVILKKNDQREFKNEFNFEEELKKLINYEKDQQLRNFSNLYFNKVKKNLKINAL